MVKLTKIYTRTGDDGMTALARGGKRAKHDARIVAYGAVDETNAAIGLARLEASDRINAQLGLIQQDLFDLGADLANAEPLEETGGIEGQMIALRITEAQITRLEAEIDQLNKALAPLTSFTLPGGTPSAAALHLARTICRRAERESFALAEREAVNPAALRYLNRLSDLLFVMSRVENAGGTGDVLWQPGATREHNGDKG